MLRGRYLNLAWRLPDEHQGAKTASTSALTSASTSTSDLNEGIWYLLPSSVFLCFSCRACGCILMCSLFLLVFCMLSGSVYLHNVIWQLDSVAMLTVVLPSCNFVIFSFSARPNFWSHSSGIPQTAILFLRYSMLRGHFFYRSTLANVVFFVGNIMFSRD